AREAMPALAAATMALEPLLTEQRIFKTSGRSPEYSKLIRRIHNKRQQFSKFFGDLNDLNEVLAGFFPLLHEEPDETVFSYLEMKEKIRPSRGNSLQGPPEATHNHEDKNSRNAQQYAPDPKRKTK